MHYLCTPCSILTPAAAAAAAAAAAVAAWSSPSGTPLQTQNQHFIYDTTQHASHAGTTDSLH